MERQKLFGDLMRLREDLSAISPHDEREQELVQRLIADIDVLMVRDDSEKHLSGLRARLDEALARLEASHPQLTLAIRQVLDSLAYLGV